MPAPTDEIDPLDGLLSLLRSRCPVEELPHYTVTDVARSSGSSRQAIYRRYPGGVAEMYIALRDELIAETLSSLASAVRRLPDRADFRAVVATAVDGATVAVTSNRYGRILLTQGWDICVKTLLDPDPGGVVHRLSRYAARCAASYGSELDSGDIMNVSEDFVIQLLVRLIRQHARGPIPINFSDDVEDLIEGFVGRVRLPDPERSLSFLAVLP